MTEPRKLQDRIAIAFEPATPVEANGAGNMAAFHDALGDIVICRNLDGVILAANRTFHAVSGIDDPIGRTCAALGIVFKPGPAPHAYDVEFETSAFPRIFLWQDVVTRDAETGSAMVQSIAREVTAERRRIASASRGSSPMSATRSARR
jgi:PAS domain-containing protein